MVLTGGIASGKSTAGKLLRGKFPGVRFFDSDLSVRGLLTGDREVARRLEEGFGSGVRNGNGEIDRDFLRDEIFSNTGSRKKLEEILHPRVRQECLDLLAAAASNGEGMFIADVPLFFETGFDFGQDEVLVVACSRQRQIERLRNRNGFDDRLIESILAAQLPIEEKIRRADVVFWNEGPLELLERQVHRFCPALP